MKKIITLCLSLCMTAALAAPAYALEYSIDAPDDYDFGRNTPSMSFTRRMAAPCATKM